MNFLIASTDPTAGAELVGRLISVSVGSLLLLLGVIKCISLARRPTTNGPCVMALGLLLLSLMLLTLSIGIGMWLPSYDSITFLLGGILLTLLSLSTLFLAVVGLITHDQKLHMQGRVQAFVGAGIALPLFCFGTFGLLLWASEKQPSEVVLLHNVTRKAWGYSTHLPPAEWKNWPDNGVALADFSALRANEGVQVIPVDLIQKAPDLEAVAAGLLARFGIRYPSDDGWVTKRWDSAWGEGLEITGSRTVDDTEFDYILRVVVKDTLAQVHAGWATKKVGDLVLSRAALDSITLSQPQPPSPVLSKTQAVDFGLVCNDIGIALYRKNQFKESVPWFKLAFEQTTKDGPILNNVLDAHRKAGLHEEGLAYAKPRLGLFPKNTTLHLHHAYLLSSTGDHAAAAKAFQQSVEAGLKDEDETLGWLQHLNEEDQSALAEQSAEVWMKKRPDVNSRRWHAQTVITAGDEKRGLALFEALSKEFPDDRRASYDYGEALNSAGDHAHAATFAEKLLADGKNASRALMMLGWSQMGRKWYREAKETFEKVAAQAPDDETVQDALRSASAMLGQGNNSDIKTVVQPVALPETLLALMKEHPATKDYGGSRPYALLLSAEGWHFEPGKPTRRTRHRRFRINTTEGANDLSSIEHSFDPLSERIHINRLTVTDESGQNLASAPGDAYVMDLNNGQGSHRKKLHFQIPALRPGCIVEYELSTEDRGTSSRFEFERYQFGDSAADIVFVTGAVDAVQVAATRLEDLQTVREKDLIAWLGFNMPHDRAEPMSGLYEDRVPCLWLGGKEDKAGKDGAGETWAEVGTAFLKDIDDRLKPDAEAAALAARLIEGLKTPVEKIAALTGHVQKQISYTAIEFGTRARRPNPAAQTLRQQYGDCKDQALLLHQLLKAAGIESHLTLVNTQWRVQPALADLNQFNHMVVHVPSLGDGWLIDPTDKHLPAHLWPADGLWHTHALILQPGAPRLAPPCKGATPESCLVTSQRSIRPSGDAWHVEETLTLHGYYASWMKSSFTGLEAAAQLRKIQSTLDQNAPVRVHDFRFEGLTEISQPARLVITYDVVSRLHAEDGLMRAALPALWENEYLATTFMKERKCPLVVRYPLNMRSDVALTGVPHLTPSSAKALIASADGPFARWKIDTSATADFAKIHFEFISHAGQHPPASYAKWQDEWHAALKSWDQPLVWKP